MRRGWRDDGSRLQQAADVVSGQHAARQGPLVHDPGEQLALAGLQREHLVLDGVGGDEPIDEDVLVLADPVGAVDGLGLGRRVPPRVEQEDVVRLGEGQPEPCLLYTSRCV